MKKIIIFISLTVLLLAGCDDQPKLSQEECSKLEADHDIKKVFEEGNVTVLKDFVACGFELNTPIVENGVLPLFGATLMGQTEMVEYLIDAGADVDAGFNDGFEIEDKRNFGNTALIAAIRADRDEIGKILLENGASIYAREASIKYQAFTLAATECSATMLSYFIDHGGDPMGDTRVGKLIDFLSKMGKTESVQLLLQHKDVAESRHSAIHWAAQEGYLETVEALISVGDDLDNDQHYLNLGLLGSASTNNVELMEFLVDRGADVNSHYGDGTSVLMRVAEWGHKEATVFLLENNVDINAEDDEGNTALSVAEEKEHNEILNLLLEHQS